MNSCMGCSLQKRISFNFNNNLPGHRAVITLFVFITFTQPVKDWNLIDLLKLQEKLSKVIRYILFWRELLKTLNLMVKSFVNQINKWRIFKLCTLSYIFCNIPIYLQLIFNYSLINSNDYCLEQIKFK